MAERGRGALSRQKRAEIAASAPPPAWQAEGLSRVERVIAFLESTPITKGHLAGEMMKLLPSQREFIERVYGQEGVRLAILSEPRGNGKTGLLAPLTLCHLAGPEALPRGETYSAAVDKDQAAILFKEMCAIVAEVPDLKARINPIKHFKQMEVLAGQGEGSTYEALSKDSGPAHGLAPSFWCYDELGQAKGADLFNALDTAMGKQPGAMGVIISVQAADDEHIMSQLLDDGVTGVDPSTYVQLYMAPEDADPFDPEVWAACNPALGTFLSFEDLEKQANRAKRVPSLESAFRNLRLNQRVHADERLIAPADWKACLGEIDVPDLRGRACWGGLDLSSTTDLTALVLVFEGRPRPVLAWFWMPHGKIDEMAHKDHQTYRLWVERGLIETTPGRAIDKRAVAIRLAEISSQYDLRALGFDDWRFADLAKILYDEGIELPLRPLRQGFKTMGPCVDALEAAVVDREIVHDGNPVMTMCISNAVAVSDPTGSRKLDKVRSRSRIDGAVCLAMAEGLRATELLAPAGRAFRVDDIERMLVA